MDKVKETLKKINIDHIRLIFAFMIITIHTYPFTCISDLTDYMFTRVLFRICVPIYLMITGYFGLPKMIESRENLIKFIKKISLIYGISAFLYLITVIKSYPTNGINAVLYFLKKVLFTGTIYHLWYFPALILGLIVSYIIVKYINKKHIIIIPIILYIIGLLGDNYYGFINNIYPVRMFYTFIFNITENTRNFLFYIPIFIILGYKVSVDKPVMDKKKNIIYICIFTIFMFIEGLIVYLVGNPHHTSMYVFLPILSYYLFIYFNNYLDKTENKEIRKLSTLIYIMHPLIIMIITKVNIFKNSFIFYLIVSIITYLVCRLFYYCKNKYKKISKNQ